MSDVVNYVQNFEPIGAGIGFGGSGLHEPPAGYDKHDDPVFPGNTVIDDPVISVRGLTKSFGKKTVLEDISIDFPRGKITTVIGPSGTGKSVFLRNLIGLLTPTAARSGSARTTSPPCGASGCSRCASSSGCCSRTARCSGR
jgi:ABC-type multidrug transport system fused ATPase/permease subunit